MEVKKESRFIVVTYKLAKPCRPMRGAGGETPAGGFFPNQAMLPLHHESAFDLTKQVCLTPLRSRWKGFLKRPYIVPEFISPPCENSLILFK